MRTNSVSSTSLDAAPAEVADDVGIGVASSDDIRASGALSQPTAAASTTITVMTRDCDARNRPELMTRSGSDAAGRIPKGCTTPDAGQPSPDLNRRDSA